MNAQATDTPAAAAPATAPATATAPAPMHRGEAPATATKTATKARRTRMTKEDRFKELPIEDQRALIDDVSDRRNKIRDLSVKHNVYYEDLNHWIKIGMLCPPPIEWS